MTLPQLRYTIVTSSTLMIVGALTYFDIIYIMTDGGPGYTTRVLSLDMYHAAFLQNQFGYASVLAVVLGVIGLAIAIGLVRPHRVHLHGQPAGGRRVTAAAARPARRAARRAPRRLRRPVRRRRRVRAGHGVAGDRRSRRCTTWCWPASAARAPT